MLLSGCDAFMGGQDNPFITSTEAATSAATATPTPTTTCSNFPFESVFSAYGTVHYTQMLSDNLTLDVDMWTEQKTHEWYADTDKTLKFVINVQDTADGLTLDSPFTDRRAVYMSKLVLKGDTMTATGATEEPLNETLDPRDETLDPEALHKGNGLLITSPKGGFQRKTDTTIGQLAADTIGINMNFTLSLKVQHKQNSKTYDATTVNVTLPIAIFDEATKDDSTSCATNATLAPVPQS